MAADELESDAIAATDYATCRAELDALIAAWYDRGVGPAVAGYVAAGYGCALLAIIGESWTKFEAAVTADWKRRGGQP